MRRSTDHILSTHGGNLPRPADLDALLASASDNKAEIQARLPTAVQEVVDKQIACGVDVINDGEYVKAANKGNYVGYIQSRVTGFGVQPLPEGAPPKRAGIAERDRRDFPGFYASGLWLSGSGGPIRPGFAQAGAAAPQSGRNDQVCNGPVTYIGQAAIQKDIDALKVALEGKPEVDGFIAALGPLSLGAGVRNLHYKTERDYMFAVADTMRQEYKAITDAGLIVQVDEPEFCTTWMFYPEWSVEDYRRYLDFSVEVINHAVEGLPIEQIRFHTCWGSGHRPHVNDIGFEHVIDKMLAINAQCYTFEASNPRHAHEWTLWQDIKLAEGKIIAPGVVGHYTDLVEHPELVAERLVRFAEIVGKENLQASTDCGIGSRVGHEEVVWAKLKAMSEGCRIAGERLKGH